MYPGHLATGWLVRLPCNPRVWGSNPPQCSDRERRSECPCDLATALLCLQQLHAGLSVRFQSLVTKQNTFGLKMNNVGCFLIESLDSCLRGRRITRQVSVTYICLSRPSGMGWLCFLPFAKGAPSPSRSRQTVSQHTGTRPSTWC